MSFEQPLPKTYRVDDPLRRTVVVLGAVLIAILATLALLDVAHAGGQRLVVLVVLCAAVGAGMWAVFSWRTTLWSDRVDVFDGWQTRSLRVEGIRAYRKHSSLRMVQLIPRDSRQRAIWVSSAILAEKAQHDWIATLVDADQEAREQMRRDFDADTRLGATHLERQMFMARMLRWARVLTVVGWVVGAWVWFWPEPYGLAILVGCVLPACAIALHVWSHGFVRVSFGDKDERPSVGAAFLAPAIAVWARAVDDFDLIDITTVFWLACAGGAALGIAFVVFDKTLRQQVVFASVMALFAGGYLYAVMTLANVQLDTAPASAFRTEVREMHLAGKRQEPTLTLGPWGSLTKARDVVVPRALYDQTKRGDFVCVTQRPGLLGWAWYEVARCAEAALTSFPASPSQPHDRSSWRRVG